MNEIVKREIILTYEGRKPSCRVCIDNKITDRFRKIYSKYKLFNKLSNFKIIPVRDIGKGGSYNKERRVPLNSRGGIRYHYLSKIEKNAILAKRFDEVKDSEKFGKILGFPRCCIEFFNHYYKEANSKQGDFILCVLKETIEPPPYNFYNNYAARYFGYSLLSHFPCSFSCKQSAQIAENYRLILEKYSSSWAKNFERIQKSTILYTEYHGIFLFKKYKLKQSTFWYDNNEILSTIDNYLFSDLKQGNNIKIVNKNYVIIFSNDNKLRDLSGENIGICIFT